jgi:ring-1,2-phenylacetyl-CoA epoxidase subunit PaaC
MQEAIDYLWRYTDELFFMSEAENAMAKEGIGIDVSTFKEKYYAEVSEILKEATLSIPENKYFTKGGKEGVHTEHMGYILADLQYMQRTYPNMTW